MQKCVSDQSEELHFCPPDFSGQATFIGWVRKSFRLWKNPLYSVIPLRNKFHSKEQPIWVNDELINTKFRDGKKNFKLVKDAEKILYNLDSVKNSNYVIFVEGEIDVASWLTAGKKSAVSVPNGFTKSGKVNMDYLDNYVHIFDSIETIYIGVDDDEVFLFCFSSSSDRKSVV